MKKFNVPHPLTPSPNSKISQASWIHLFGEGDDIREGLVPLSAGYSPF